MWRPDTTPAILILGPAPAPPSEPPLFLAHLRPISSGWPSPDEQHLVADDERGRHRLVLRVPNLAQPLALLLPIDTDMSIRLDAAARLTHSAGVTAAYLPTPLQRRRLVLLLHILDAAEEGLSKREIAKCLLYRNMAELHGATWKGSSERRRIHRLALEALRLRDKGFGDLLHGRLRRSG